MKDIYIGIDESGIATKHRNNIENISNNRRIDEQYFSLTFIVMETSEFFKSRLKINLFKKHLKIDVIHLSSFSKKNFVVSWLNLLADQNFKIYYSFVDLNSFYSKYKKNSYNPYLLSFTYLLERLLRDYSDFKLNFIVESISLNLEKNLITKLIETLNQTKKIQNLKSIVYVNKSSISKHYSIIEIADSISYILTKLNLHDKNKIWELFEKNNLNSIGYYRDFILTKFAKYPKINGYSFKVIK